MGSCGQKNGPVLCSFSRNSSRRRKDRGAPRNSGMSVWETVQVWHLGHSSCWQWKVRVRPVFVEERGKEAAVVSSAPKQPQNSLHTILSQYSQTTPSPPNQSLGKWSGHTLVIFRLIFIPLIHHFAQIVFGWQMRNIKDEYCVKY